ncbi:PIG-L deacetylase family protein [Solicola sp. PLA-1-18]|uniref:PIG-L deacetylase family protein n=1 Tax=Solicola sp. PLA-1-18 TaxID=3380532 RepID=UPI003B7C350E
MTRRAGAARDSTPEAAWAAWPGWLDLPVLDVPHGARVVSVSAHPDDDVLAVGGLLQELVARGARVDAVVLTDGEGSHPGSPTLGPDDLRRVRRRESDDALAALGLHMTAHRPGLPDSGLHRHPDLAGALAPSLAGADVVLAPWRLDGHPDHEAVGRACAAVTDGRSALWEYPVWAWHWARPGADDLPWHAAAVVHLDDDQRRRKADAVACFTSQVTPLSSDPRDVAVLPPEVLAHFARPFEVVLR